VEPQVPDPGDALWRHEAVGRGRNEGIAVAGVAKDDVARHDARTDDGRWTLRPRKDSNSRAKLYDELRRSTSTANAGPCRCSHASWPATAVGSQT